MSYTDDELAFFSAVFDAARNGDTEGLRGVLEAGLSPNITNSSGDTLLILAAYRRQAAVVDLLLSHGADTERVNDRGQTALASAVFRRDEAIVRRLLDAGADPSTGEKSAWAIARFFDLADMVQILESADAPGGAVAASDDRDGAGPDA